MNNSASLATGIAVGLAVSNSQNDARSRRELRYLCEKDYQSNACDDVCVYDRLVTKRPTSFLFEEQTRVSTNECLGTHAEPYTTDGVRELVVFSMVVVVLVVAVIVARIFDL